MTDDETIVQRIIAEWLRMMCAPPTAWQRALATAALQVVKKELSKGTGK